MPGFLHRLTTLFSYIWRDPSNKGQRGRRLLYALYWQIHYRFIRVPFVVHLDNGLKWLITPKFGTGAGVLYVRLYESRYISFVRRHVVPGGTLCDVGTSDGLYCLLVCPAFVRGYCFEPDEEALDFAKVEFALNKRFDLTTVNAAVAERSGISTLVRPREGGLWRVTEDGEDISKLETRETKLVTLDEIVGDVRNLTFLKIDTEGHELNVLRGAKQVLANNPGMLAHIEVTGNRPQVFELLREANFRVFALDETGLPSVEAAVVAREHDFIACGPQHRLWPSAKSIV